MCACAKPNLSGLCQPPHKSLVARFVWSCVATMKSVYLPSRPLTLLFKLSRVSWATDIEVSSMAMQSSKASMEEAFGFLWDFVYMHPSSQPLACFSCSTSTTPSCDVLERLGIILELDCVGANLALIPLVMGWVCCAVTDAALRQILEQKLLSKPIELLKLA